MLQTFIRNPVSGCIAVFFKNHRINQLIKNLPLKLDSVVADIGAGTGLLGLDLLADVGSVVLADPSEGMIEVARTKIEAEGIVIYSNPLPHVLMLTAIVVGVATTALALALVVRIQEAYGTLEEDELREIEREEEA